MLLFLIPYSLFYRIDYIPYLPRIRNKEQVKVFIPYSLFYQIDVTLGMQQPTPNVLR